MPDLFVPNELETHLITIHKVSPKIIASTRRFCRTRGRDYGEFLRLSHDLIHLMRRTEGDCDDAG